MKIIRTKDYADMSRKAANIISAQVIMKPDCVLGLATGGTPVGIYENLVERYNEGDLDFSEVTSVNLDEYRGLPKEHPESYWSFMHRNLFDHVNIDPAHINLPDGTNMDAEAECKRYDEVIRSVGGVDLTQETIEANKRFFDGNVDLVPKQAYTMGIRTIMQARKVLMVVNGAGKAEIVKKAFFGPVTPEVPASILQMHPDFILVADEEALSLI